MEVNCFLCGKSQNDLEIDALMLNYMSKNAYASYQAHKELGWNPDWKYVCNDCAKTAAYLEWSITMEGRGHIILPKEAET